MNSSIFTSSELIDASDVVDILTRLQLSVFPQEYVEQVLSSNYNYYQFPDSYEMVVMPDIDFPAIMTDACELLSSSFLQEPSKHVLWDRFIEEEIHPKSLSCLLNCYIQNGIKELKEPSYRKNALLASRLFFLASCFKGSKNIGFYHICLLTKSSELIRTCIAMFHGYGRISTNENSESSELQEDEKLDLMTNILAIVKDLEIMVKRFQFFDEVTSLSSVIDIMVDVTRLERTTGSIFEHVPTNDLSYGTLAFNAYTVLISMFNDNCGSTINVGKQMMHLILPGLLVDEQREMQLTTKQFNAIRDHHLSFIKKITKKLGTLFEPILEILLQHLLHRGPDRSELKPRQSQIILEVWRICSSNVRIKMKYYLLCLAYDVDAKVRAVALETLFKLLSEPEETESEDPDLKHLMPATKHEFILAVILSRFQDPLLTVRAKAFSLIATMTAGPPTASTHQTNLIKKVLVDPYHNVENLDQTSFCKRDFHEFYYYLKNNMEDFDSNNIKNSTIYPGAKILLWVLNVHARDERAHIRRLSLTLLCNLFLINKKFMEKFYLSLLLDSCSDCSMTIRKVVVTGLTDLILAYPENENVLKHWFKGLIHLVGDRDKKIQDLAVECMDKVILQNIKPYSAKVIDSQNPLDNLPWKIVDYAMNEKVGKYMLCLSEKWKMNGLLTDYNVKTIMSYVGSPNHEWTIHCLYLLQLISHQLTITNMNPVVRYFEVQSENWFFNNADPAELNCLLTDAQMTLDIMSLNHKRLDKDTRNNLLNKFEKLLFNFLVPTRLISKSLDILTVLLMDKPENLEKFMNDLFKKICNFLESSTHVDNEEIFIRYMCTLGDIGLAQYLKINRKLQQYLLAFLRNTENSISPAFKAIIVLTIGKLSIVDERFAKEAIVEFGLILKTACHPSIKINALTALSDLCLRCTTLVEQAIPEMCVCLKADSIPVKRVALKLLTGLILEDYIKLRDVAFFALLCMLEDPDWQVRQETSSFIVNYLLIKNKDIMERKLIEVIFHFNGYTGERAGGLEDCFTSPELRAFFSMEGESKKASRHCVYRFMLTHMLDDSKLKLMVKICKNILEEAARETNVNEFNSEDDKERATQVLKDAFWILKAKEMALTSGRPRDSGNDDDPGTLEKVADLAKKQLVMETYKMVIIDYVVPAVLKLKYELDKSKKFRPTVMNDLRAFLCCLTSGRSPIKNDVVKLLSADGDLATEVLFDVKQQQKQQNANGENVEFENESEDEDDDEPDLLIQDLEYVTWAQIMDMRDKAEESGIDQAVQHQLAEELQQQVSQIVEENNSEEAVVANVSHVTGEATGSINLKRKISRSSINQSCRNTKEETKLHKSDSSILNHDASLKKTDPENNDLPFYKKCS
ncbi:condensin-2 complex subunit D3-like [Daktulosphaira vitifoliae]|uniref:condensin-2 complex subunit D3-like n=1 Tax=Daktulosphaira vitifoliae TaxID=58002 RepID=UPI0021AA1F35|nr:condensin-2 complex subunit D3-like [Daktulosphaira vitifoliae]